MNMIKKLFPCLFIGNIAVLVIFIYSMKACWQIQIMLFFRCPNRFGVYDGSKALQ